ncbi:MAG TPA: beta-lactamase family protein [Candidatus Ventricola intestinavium]|nr:beta-lactamase family protein [Candidatus Ventricola intestinavium]
MIRIKHWISVLLMFALLLAGGLAQEGALAGGTGAVAAGADEKAKMDEQVDRIFQQTQTVGGAFLVAQHGEIVYERYYGVQQKTTGVPVTEKSYFRCASVTKLVTGIGLMKMMEDGLLDPDEDISTYLGYAVGNPRYTDTPVTLRHLMSHTAGLNENASYSSKSSLLSDMIALERKARSNFRDVRPGTEYAYSNFGAGITGAIIESVTGEDVFSYMRAYLFEPLGIDAAYTATQLEEPEYITATYHPDGSLYAAPSYMLRQEYQAQASPDTHYRVTVGSLLIRPRDLMRLGIALCGDGTVDGIRVLREESLARMRQEQSPQTTGITADSPYSFFTIRQDTLLEGRRVYGHQGTDDGVVCNLYYEPESELVLVVMVNGCKTTREDGIMRITRRLSAIAEEAYLGTGAAQGD